MAVTLMNSHSKKCAMKVMHWEFLIRWKTKRFKSTTMLSSAWLRKISYKTKKMIITLLTRWDKPFSISWNLFFVIYLIFTRTLQRWMTRILFSVTTSIKLNMRALLTAKDSKTLLKLWLIPVNFKISATTFSKRMK
jgi:hypothetical protein